jgi:hypothetical protein
MCLPEPREIYFLKGNNAEKYKQNFGISSEGPLALSPIVGTLLVRWRSPPPPQQPSP